MTTPNPLVPQGSFLEKPGKSHIRIAVFTILAIHVVLLGALLLQGCKRTTDVVDAGGATNDYSIWETPTSPPVANTNNASSPLAGLPAPPPPTTPPPSIGGSGTGAVIPDPSTTPPGTTIESATPPPLSPSAATPPPPTTPPPTAPPTTTIPPETGNAGNISSPPIPAPPSPSPGALQPPPTPPAPVATGTQYVVLKGDSFSLLAKKFGVSVQDIANNNPRVDPRRLQIGQILLIPAPSSGGSDNTTVAASASGQKTYKVKSGDTLSKIARRYGTTVKALQAQNNLRTTVIKVGQALVIPPDATNP